MHLATRRFPSNPGPAAWNELLPAPPAAQPLIGQQAADVVIVGAGFAGLSAARRLMQHRPDARILVLDALRIAEGAAGRNSGFMIDLPHDLASSDYAGSSGSAGRADVAANRLAIAFAADIARDADMPRTTFDPCGKINAASCHASDRLNRDYAGHLTALGEPYEWLDAAAMLERTGSQWFTSGVHTPGTVMLQPAAYIRDLADTLRQAGVIFHENSPVRSVDRTGDHWHICTPTGTLDAPQVIMATNGHAASFGLFARQLIHVSTFASMTARFAPDALAGASTWGATPAEPLGTSVRRITDGDACRLIVRTCVSHDPTLGGNVGATERTWRRHDQRLRERFPTLATIAMDYRWGGHLCLSRNAAPAHGEVAPGLFAAVCQNGLGTAKGTLAGISVADLCCGMSTDATRALLEQGAPQRLPVEPLASIGIDATLAWKQLRAGKE